MIEEQDDESGGEFQNAGADAVPEHPDTGGGIKEVPGQVQVVLVQGKVEQVEQHSHTVSEDGCQTGTEHAHAQLHGKDIVQHDIADIAGGAGDHHQTGVAVRPDDDAQGARRRYRQRRAG